MSVTRGMLEGFHLALSLAWLAGDAVGTVESGSIMKKVRIGRTLYSSARCRNENERIKPDSTEQVPPVCVCKKPFLHQMKAGND